MARYMDELIQLIAMGEGTNTQKFKMKCYVELSPTADVVERGPFAKRLLLDLKAAVTNKATYPDCKADYAYINLKVFNALVQEFIKKYEEGKSVDILQDDN